MNLLLKLLTAARLLVPYLVKLAKLVRAKKVAASPTKPEFSKVTQASTVPREWAQAFARAIEVDPAMAFDEGAMMMWFSYAIMAGYNAGKLYTRIDPASEAAASIPVPAAKTGDVCSICGWTNVSLLNVGECGRPRLVCHGCIKRAFDYVPGTLGAMTPQ